LIRARVERDLHGAPLSRAQVLATIVRLLEETLIRIGNDEYAKANGSFGLTTLRNEHVDVRGSRIRFRFRGKSGKHRDLTIENAEIATIVRRCRKLVGRELFQYIDAHGKRRDIKAEDVNGYLREITGRDFTAKDFRTWAGTVHAALALECAPPCSNKIETKRAIVRAIEHVADKLGNTPAVCRKAYVHPVVIEHFECNGLAACLRKHRNSASKREFRGLTLGEQAVLAFLRECLMRE
jgi:DNA topoisomerase-1